MNLPKPRLNGDVSVEQAIKHRRTIRSYLSKPLTLEQFSQIFWAAQGITEDRGYKRSAPSGGALYPMDIYAMIEAGHIGQNIFLQAEAPGLRAGIVGAFHDKDVIRVMKITGSHAPLLILPVGYGV